RGNPDLFSVTPDGATRSPRAQAEPGHEHGKYDGDQRCSDAELRHGQPEPDDFVEDAAESRDEEEEEKPTHQGASGKAFFAFFAFFAVKILIWFAGEIKSCNRKSKQ